jgi:hypothetical protein
MQKKNRYYCAGCMAKGEDATPEGRTSTRRVISGVSKDDLKSILGFLDSDKMRSELPEVGELQVCDPCYESVLSGPSVAECIHAITCYIAEPSKVKSMARLLEV